MQISHLADTLIYSDLRSIALLKGNSVFMDFPLWYMNQQTFTYIFINQ